jgi:hypothetical protein
MFARSLLTVAIVVNLVPLTAAAADGWQFRLSPYLWFAGLKGTVATIPGAPAAPIDLSPSKAIEDTETGLMLLFDARHGRHGLLADFIYTNVRSDEQLMPPPIGLSLRLVTKTTIFSLAYQYEIFRKDQAIADLALGARYWNIDSELGLGTGQDR